MKISRFDEKKIKGAIIFCLKFACFSIPIHVVKWLGINLWFLQYPITSVLAMLLPIFGIHFEVFHTLSPESLGEIPAIYVKELNYSFAIDNSCTGYISILALCGLVISTPSNEWRRKLKFLSLSIPLLYGINVVRIFITILILTQIGVKYVDVVHSILWREFLLSIVVVLWVIYLRNARVSV
ncbi:MAG: exosortase/archaeosortase family protein [Candidatus Nanoarchaeia archaeon]|nr:exosortase/archaeosortase family protein [Candidatus Haiyanarchaeum thermophilum]MCW1303379.1 exosortase/archaeosortase family protein [Candidatus Haiyanarchaeum thermophilum]MCW1303934.1 exosortase/archaeosortase family protein [Candidatus Haiyanarchaeum thermophilum]MCW1306741.1 exosortase/archaeosortase family protein [Candidatus Haiyanarchaeum thermophilum]MCW1308182.1 exosortase/archaeosortase family protein [Candidatus Haiyanarchaeum thermophilum]